MFVIACTTLKAVFVTKMQSKSQNKEQKRHISANPTKKCATATKQNSLVDNNYEQKRVKKILTLFYVIESIMFHLIHIFSSSIERLYSTER